LYKSLHHVNGQGLCDKPIRASGICWRQPSTR
jgi:hypothetical protein